MVLALPPRVLEEEHTASVARGATLEQAIQAVQLPAKYSAFRFQNLFPANVQKMYAELKTLEAEAEPKGEASKTNVKGK